MKKLLTLGIPTFNDANKLPQVLRAIQDQNLEKLPFLTEIIVVDNASTDHTREIVEKFMADNPNLDIRYYHNEKNIGGRANGFKLIELARGEYIWIVCDDLLMPGALKSFEFYVSKTQPDIVQLGTAGFEGSEKNILWKNDVKPNQVIKNFIHQDLAFSMFVGNLIIKKSLWDKAAKKDLCRASSYSHVWLALHYFAKSKVLFLYEKIYVKQRLTRRNHDLIPLRMMQETVLEILKCLNQNQTALKHHFKRLELLYLKLLWVHHLENFKHQLKTIPIKEKIKIFCELIKVSKIRRKQIKFLAKIAFYLFQPSKTFLSAKDREWLQIGDLSNGANDKIMI